MGRNSRQFISADWALEVRFDKEGASDHFDTMTTGFSEPERLTQRKSNRRIEGFVCIALLRYIILACEIYCDQRSSSFGYVM